MKPCIAIALICASLAGCATSPTGPNAAHSTAPAAPDAAVVPQEANGVPVQTIPRRVPRVGVGIGLGSSGGRGFGGLGIGLGF